MRSADEKNDKMKCADVRMWTCEGMHMTCADVKIRKCDDGKCRCGMSRCENVKTLCADVKMRKCEDVKKAM